MFLFVLSTREDGNSERNSEYEEYTTTNKTGSYDFHIEREKLSQKLKIIGFWLQGWSVDSSGVFPSLFLLSECMEYSDNWEALIH